MVYRNRKCEIGDWYYVASVLNGDDDGVVSCYVAVSGVGLGVPKECRMVLRSLCHSVCVQRGALEESIFWILDRPF